MEAGSLEHLRSAWLLQQIPQESQTTINSFDTKVFEESHMERDTKQTSCRALPALPQSHLLVISSRGIPQDCWGKKAHRPLDSCEACWSTTHIRVAECMRDREAESRTRSDSATPPPGAPRYPQKQSPELPVPSGC